VPFDSAEHYAACVTDLESFRQHLTEVFAKHPELFPAGISEGFVLHDKSWSIKQQVMRRRIALQATAGVFLVRRVLPTSPREFRFSIAYSHPS